MKAALIIAIALVLSSVPMHSQQASAGAQNSASATVGSRSVHESSSTSVNANRNSISGAADASGSTQTNLKMNPVNGELQSSLDAKHARVGQQVIVKTTQKARMADGTVIPKGTRLIGHVTRVEPRESGNAGSSMAIDFDRAELKGGQSMAIHSMIESVSPAANLAASSMANEDDDGMMAPAGGGGFARGGGGIVRTSASRGGGLIGGATSDVARGTGSAVGAAGSSLVSTTDSVGRNTAGATGRAAGDLNATAGNGLRGAAGGTAALAAHATGIPGVMLAGDASGATSGTLSASRKNLHLDSGTQLVLGVSSAVR